MAEPNWKNRTLFHGDNLGFLRAMNSESVDLIATDPPFNKGRDFHAMPDSLAKGAKFQGCNRVFDDPRYLELDHNIPRSDGGLNHISNRILLCGPCNRLKSNIYTLSGLRRQNQKKGYVR